jgi:hypothetical protein
MLKDEHQNQTTTISRTCMQSQGRINDKLIAGEFSCWGIQGKLVSFRRGTCDKSLGVVRIATSLVIKALGRGRNKIDSLVTIY